MKCFFQTFGRISACLRNNDFEEYNFFNAIPITKDNMIWITHSTMNLVEDKYSGIKAWICAVNSR